MEAEATAAIFQDRGIMRIACLADGSAWALVQPDQLARLQARAALWDALWHFRQSHLWHMQLHWCF
jgi:hypothetical protein